MKQCAPAPKASPWQGCVTLIASVLPSVTAVKTKVNNQPEIFAIVNDYTFDIFGEIGQNFGAIAKNNNTNDKNFQLRSIKAF